MTAQPKKCELLDRLLKHFYRSDSGNLIWSYPEDTPLAQVDFELNQALLKYLADDEQQGS